MNTKIWIDLDNSPHVLFFKPIIRELRDRDYAVLITARDAFQVKDLLRQMDISAAVISRHYGKKSLLKLAGLFFRAWQLKPLVSKFRPDLALSHGSRSQLILAKALGVKTMMFLDYEFVTLIPFFYPDYLVTPEVVAAENFMSYGIKIMHYPGIKEEVYIPEVLSFLNRSYESTLPSKIYVTIREPATEAHYFVPESEKLFEFVMDYLLTLDNVFIVLLARNRKRREYCSKRWETLLNKKRLIVPEHAVDGLSLLWNSDLVISGGGTMNREAAILGVPVYSIFRGRLGAVDHYLSTTGRLTIIKDKDDCLHKIKICKHTHHPAYLPLSVKSLTTIIELIQTTLKSQPADRATKSLSNA